MPTDSALGDEQQWLIAVDPGRSKCGVVVVSYAPFTVHDRQIVPSERLTIEIRSFLRNYTAVSTILMGDGTQSRTLRKAIDEEFPDFRVVLVDEKNSSQRARRQYIETHRPTGWQLLVPKSLRSPDKPYDDVVAEILAKDFLQIT